ncbi:TetR/AcrR family transcriptional regulator [Rhizobium sp. ZPR3]|uniref:TetR/AcrR family transcriptional regulator n=2 Tax=unclassified Rhizobium TaxID=2613769 RepID=A0AAU7SQT4_9HYPH
MSALTARTKREEPASLKKITPPRPRGRPPKGSEAQLTDDIVAAAQQLFLLHGYEGTSTDDVAGVAQCSKRTMYTRFATKADLFEAVILKFVKEKQAHTSTYIAGGLSLRERLVKLTERMVKTFLEPDVLALYFLIHKEATRFPELARIVEEAGRKPSQQMLKSVLAEGGVKGDLDFLAEQFFSLIHAPVVRRALAGNTDATEELLENERRSVDFFLRGCGVAADS